MLSGVAQGRVISKGPRLGVAREGRRLPRGVWMAGRCAPLILRVPQDERNGVCLRGPARVLCGSRAVAWVLAPAGTGPRHGGQALRFASLRPG